MNNISQRIVHFDLKGAPWKVSYLKEVIVLAKAWGATGIIYEWEDSFPYTGHLLCIGSLGGCSREGLYSENEIQQLLQYTIDNGMEPIQLVQTLGHLEFVLKHSELVHMRELANFPSVLCPTRPGGKELVVSMIKQVLAMQPDAKFIHIGTDEAWHMNKCYDCILKSSTASLGVDSLFINHIQEVVTEIRKFYPGVKFLIWDDMMRRIPEESLIKGNLSSYITPVVWHYNPLGQFALSQEMWLKYDKCFTEVWAASAFKGANGSCQMLSSVEHYVSNQEAWMQQIQLLGALKLKITGVVLTGWSRFDHYATLCELLPVSLPSLASCLKIWTKPDHVPRDTVVSATLPVAWWPGAQCARAVRDLHACRERCHAFLHGDAVQTWMNPWQLAHDYTTPMQLIPIGNTARLLSQELNVLGAEISCHLHALCGARSAGEWLQTNVTSPSDAVAQVARLAAQRSQHEPSVLAVPRAVNKSSQES